MIPIWTDTATDDSASGSKPKLTFVTTTSTTTKSPVEMRDLLASQSQEELVRPSKLPPRPMLDQDMLIEMRMKDVAGGKSMRSHVTTIEDARQFEL